MGVSKHTRLVIVQVNNLTLSYFPEIIEHQLEIIIEFFTIKLRIRGHSASVSFIGCGQVVRVLAYDRLVAHGHADPLLFERVMNRVFLQPVYDLRWRLLSEHFFL